VGAQRLRIGFLGTGAMAAPHLRNLAGMDGVTIAAVCDLARDRVDAAAGTYGATAYTDFTAMLDAERLDALYVVVPPFAHTGQELAAIERGIHLFVEKPVALDLDLARRTADALGRRGLIGAVGYNWRHLESVQEVKRRVAPEEVALALGYWIGGLPGVGWWRRMDGSGGQVVEQTTHIFDLARYLLGEVTVVTAMGVRGHFADVPDYSVHDASAVNLRFASGAVATIASGCLAGNHGRVRLELIGRDLWVEIESGGKTTYRRGEETAEFSSPVNPYVLEDRLFVDAVRRADPSGIRAPYADAVKTLQVTLEATRVMDDYAVARL
jgi:predicted dehydrogenase